MSMLMLGQAIALAAEKFSALNKTDKGGKPYILHCLYVMNELDKKTDEDVLCAAVLHDIFEDTDITPVDLNKLGYSHRTISLIGTLTHNPEESYLDTYIKRIAMDKDATAIKLADLTHNLLPTRLKGLSKADHDRIAKYHTAFIYLSKI